MRRRTRWNRGDDAVSEVVGSALLVGLTVAVVSVFGLVATQAFSPTKRIDADLVGHVSSGDSAWGNGDERLQVAHLGGADLPRDATTLLLRIDNGGLVTTDELAGAELTGAFADGQLSIGETWRHTLTLPTCALVEVRLTIGHEGGGSQLLLHHTLVANEGVC